MSLQISYKTLGPTTLLIEWENKISEDILHDIIRFQSIIKKNYKDQLIDIVPAYNSLGLIFKRNFTLQEEIPKIDALRSNSKEMLPSSKLWKIPVCYDAPYNLDLKQFCTDKRKSASEVIRLHTSRQYLVYFMGFLPGFLYLGGLSKVLHHPRKPTPNLNTPKGAVAIGGHQTGIYPQESPGGWHVIGNTPISLFDINAQPPCKISMGDKIQFYAINNQEYSHLENAISNRDFKLKHE